MEGEVDDESTHDPRTSNALRTRAGLTAQPQPHCWTWSVGRLDTAGRLCLGRAIVAALGPCPWRLARHHLALVVTSDPTGDGSVEVWDDATRAAFDQLDGRIDTSGALEVWEAAVASPAWADPGVWVHGDVMASNLIVRDDRGAVSSTSAARRSAIRRAT